MGIKAFVHRLLRCAQSIGVWAGALIDVNPNPPYNDLSA
jgi:hypothetical protein